jgi:glyoxylase-like metal-dependent hydrolase (beta-lactamase superfamily II)
MHIAEGIAMLDIAATVMGRASVIHSTVLWDDAGAVLVDTGYPGQQALFAAALAEVGVPVSRLWAIILTHGDMDHIGNVAGLLGAAAPGAQVIAGAAEVPFVQGEQPSPRFTPEVIERMVTSLPGDYTEERRAAFAAALAHPPTAHVDHPALDGEVLPYAGGLTVIATPGHTPGHICLYHQPSRTLIAGDALNIHDGQLQRPAETMDLNRAEATQSLEKLLTYDIATVISYHGGVYRGDIAGRLAELVNEG